MIHQAFCKGKHSFNFYEPMKEFSVPQIEEQSPKALLFFLCNKTFQCDEFSLCPSMKTFILYCANGSSFENICI